MEKRLLFKFYSSYYDVASELNDKDRLAFYDALIKREFTGVEPKLTGMANFAYISQKHSIDKQIEGWEFKTKTKLIDTIIGGCVGGVQGGVVQEEVQEKEEVKEKEKEEVEQTNSGKPEKIDFDILLKFLNKKTGRNYRIVTDKIKGKYHSLLKQGYSKTDIGNAITNAVKAQNHIDNGFQYLTLEFFSRPDKIDMYSVKKAPEEVKPKQQRPAGVWDV